MLLKLLFTALLVSAWPSQAFAQHTHGHTEEHHHHQPQTAHTGHHRAPHQSHPWGVMGAHMHKAGEWMFSLTFMGAGMGGLLNQTQVISTEQAFKEFAMVPDQMWMGMPMAGIMYAPTDWLTLMAMVPGMWMGMTHANNPTGMTTGTGHEDHMHIMQVNTSHANTMQSGGLSDISLTALFGHWQFGPHTLNGQLGFSLPTGPIDVGVPGVNGGKPQIYPYSMRLGSGTWDLQPGFSYTGYSGDWGWGFQPIATLRLGQNSLNYRLGHRLSASGWVSYRWTDWLSSSLRLQGHVWGNVEGADARLDTASQPGAESSRLGGQRLDLLAGCNFFLWSHHSLGFEVGLPIYQNLNGPQMATQWQAQVGWRMHL